MTMYIDIVIIENLIMNYIILYATGIVTKVKMKKIRVLISSLIGAIFVAIQYVTNLKIYSNIIVKTILSILMIFIAFNPQKIKQLGKQLILFYLTTFTFGGVATYLIYVIKPQDIIIKNGMFVGTYVLKTIFLGAILGTVIIIIAFKISKNKMTKKDILCQTKIKLEGKEIKKITYKNKELDDNGNVVSEQKVNLDCADLEKAEALFKCLGFWTLIEVKYHVIVYEKDGVEFAFQIVENLGTLIEYENINDFAGKSIQEIRDAKLEMLEDIRICDISISNEYVVKKAFELLAKKYEI